jgi:hypothetical protein
MLSRGERAVSVLLLLLRLLMVMVVMVQSMHRRGVVMVVVRRARRRVRVRVVRVVRVCRMRRQRREQVRMVRPRVNQLRPRSCRGPSCDQHARTSSSHRQRPRRSRRAASTHHRLDSGRGLPRRGRSPPRIPQWRQAAV